MLTKKPAQLDRAYARLLQKKDGRALEDVTLSGREIFLTWRRSELGARGVVRGVAYKTAWQLVHLALREIAFRLQPVEDAGPAELPSEQAPDAAMAPSPSPSPAPATAPSPSSSNESLAHRTEGQLQVLVGLFGAAAGHEIVARALSVLGRYQRPLSDAPGKGLESSELGPESSSTLPSNSRLAHWRDAVKLGRLQSRFRAPLRHAWQRSW